MHRGWELLLDLLVTLTAATVFGLLMERIRQSSVVGFIIAGVIVGPSVARLVQDPDTVTVIAELGVALLLFTIGLEFSLQRLIRLGRVATLGGLLQISLVTVVTGLVALAFGLDWRAALALGLVASLASTAVVLRLLKTNKALEGAHGKNSIGILLMQDVAVVPIVILLTTLGTSGERAAPLGETLIKASLLVGALALFVMLVLPRMLDTKTFARNREFAVLVAMATAVAATWGGHAAGLSPALGTFLAGLLLAESPFAHQMRADVNAFKTLFITLFFASIGMVLDLRFVGENLGIVLATLIPVMVGKAVLTALACRPFVASFVTCLAAGLVLSQIGEFSFVVAKVAQSGGLLSPFVFQLVIAVSVLSLIVTPYIVPRAVPWAKWVALRFFPKRALAVEERAMRPKRSGHVIVVGFGEAGEQSCMAISAAGHQVLVLDTDPRQVRRAEAQGFEAHLGDATQDATLDRLNYQDALCLVVSVPEPLVSAQIVGMAKSICPHVRVVARARHHVLAAEIQAGGADFIADEEALVGQSLGDLVSVCAAEWRQGQRNDFRDSSPLKSASE
ncbi:MAG: cation:proton antiporter [Fimbriimonadaceae bacterium]|nr:cation:proton antiporter [Fimbriimonadaceae bacterium]QYK56837.1 MAG: cation:proton antiporter [Fimbriimonadaceae bacterium]